jgi:hypothetical protein
MQTYPPKNRRVTFMVALVLGLGILTGVLAGISIYRAGRGWFGALFITVFISILAILTWQMFLVLVFRLIWLARFIWHKIYER